MIPLGVLAQRQAATGGGAPAIVQYKYAAAAALTLDTPPTPGNLLVIGGGCASDPSAYSHGATEDILFNRSGWRSFLASAVLAPGASSVVTVSNMLSLQRLSVWELSGVSDCVATGTDGGYASSSALSLTSGAIGLALVLQEAQTEAPRSASGLALRTEDQRFLSADGVGISTPLAVGFSWTNPYRTYSAVVGGYS